ncbi:MAG: endonuclease/exonuclease/phosphatase family protein [bacterium]
MLKNDTARRTRKPAVLRTFSVAYLALLLLVSIIWALVGERSWPLILPMHVPQFLLIPIGILLLASILTLRRFEIMVNLLAAAIVFLFLMQYHVRLPLSPKAPDPASKALRVVTYNINAGKAGVDNVIKTLKKANADIIFLQESGQAAFASLDTDPTPKILKAFPRWYSVREKKQVILSKYPLSQEEILTTSHYRCFLICRVKINKQSIRLINIHMYFSTNGESLLNNNQGTVAYLREAARITKTQADMLSKIIQEEKGPTIVAGDFNSTPLSSTHRTLSKLLTDSFDSVGRGLGYTFPSKLPLIRIDYIYLSDSLIVTDCHPVSSNSSDHFPLMADLRVPN